MCCLARVYGSCFRLPSGLVTRDEDAADFDKFRDALMEENDPQTAMECHLVERSAGISWRPRRVQLLETGVIDFR